MPAGSHAALTLARDRNQAVLSRICDRRRVTAIVSRAAPRGPYRAGPTRLSYSVPCRAVGRLGTA